MDPVGKQSKIKDGQYHVGWQKLLDGGGAKSSYGHTKSTESGTRKAVGGVVESKWQGTVKGKTVHTYAVDGKNDPEVKASNAKGRNYV